MRRGDQDEISMGLINCFGRRPAGYVGVTRRAAGIGLGPLWTADEDLEQGMGEAQWEMENVPAPGSWTVEDRQQRMEEVERDTEELWREYEELEQAIKRIARRRDEQRERMFAVPRVRRPSLWERAKGAICRRIRRRSAKIVPAAPDDEGQVNTSGPGFQE